MVPAVQFQLTQRGSSVIHNPCTTCTPGVPQVNIKHSNHLTISAAGSFRNRRLTSYLYITYGLLVKGVLPTC